MIVEKYALGDFETNCYLVRKDQDAESCLIIDPGYEPAELIEAINRQSLKPEKILLTHGHCDHIAGVGPLLQAFPGLRTAISKDEVEMLDNPMNNLSLMIGEPLSLSAADELLEPGSAVQAAGLTFKVIATPGHTPGGISLYNESEGIIFTGDALFAGSIGRTDFPYSNGSDLIAAIRDNLFCLPDETVVYSGHGPRTTIGREKQINPYV